MPDIQQQTPTQDPPLRQKLWEGLNKAGLYNKPFEDFEKQFTTDSAIKGLYDGMQQKKLYGKSFDDFRSQFFTELQQPSAPKLKATDKYASVAADTPMSAQDTIAPSEADNNTADTSPTRLSDKEEKAYQEWKQKLPGELGNDKDYDLRAQYKENPNVKPSANLHFSDKYKLPNHITFSDQSIYNGKGGAQGGKWGSVNGKDVFYAAPQNIKNAGGEDNLKKYFQQYEPNVKLILPPKADKYANVSAADIPMSTQDVITSGLNTIVDASAKAKASKLEEAGNVLKNAWDSHKDEAVKDVLTNEHELSRLTQRRGGTQMDYVQFWKAPNNDIAVALRNAKGNDEFSPQVDNVAPKVSAAVQNLIKQSQRVAVTPDEINHFLSDPNTNRVVVDKIIHRLKKEGNEKEANKVSASAYRVDRANAHGAKDVDKNADEIEKGNVHYNVETQELVKPLKGVDALAAAYNSSSKDVDEGNWLMAASDKDRLDYLEKAINTEHHPDKPVEVPEGAMALAGSDGVGMLKAFGTSIATTFLTKNPIAGSAAGAELIGTEYAAKAFKNELINSYAQVKKELMANGVPEDQASKQAVSKATANATVAMMTDFATNAAMAYTGLRYGSTKPLMMPLQKGTLNAAKQILKVPFKFVAGGASEAGANAVFGASGEYVKAAGSNLLGIKRESNIGDAVQAGATNAALHYVFGAAGEVIKGTVKGTKAIKKAVLNGAAKQPIDVMKSVALNMVEKHAMQPEIAEATLKEIERHKAFMSQFPNVKDDHSLMQLEDLVHEYSSLKEQLAKPEEGGAHEALHKPLKERQKEIEWEIAMLSQKPEDQIKTLKFKKAELERELADHKQSIADDKGGKLEDAPAVSRQLKAIDKKLSEVQERLDSPVHQAQKMIDEDIKDAEADWTQRPDYVEMAQQDPEGFLQTIAEQAQDTMTIEGHTSSSRPLTEQLFGKELTAKAVEAFPKKEKPRHTVSQAGIRAVKPKERDLSIPAVAENAPIETGADGKIPFDQFREHLLDDALAVEDSSFNFRVDIPGMQMSERIGAMKDIEAGKESVRRTKLEAAIKDMHESGTVPVTRGRGAHVERYDIPVDEWFGLNRQEQQAVAAEVPKVTDDDLRAIEEEGITLDNLHKFKHLFDGFPYNEQQYAAIERHLSTKGKGDVAVEQSGEGSASEPAAAEPSAAGEPVGEPTTVPAEPTAGVGEPPSPPPPPVAEAAPEVPKEPYATDIKHATLEEDAAFADLHDLEMNTGVSYPVLRAEGAKLVEKGAVPDIIDRAIKKQAINEYEKAALVIAKATVDQEWSRVVADYDKAVADGGGAAIRDAELKKAEVVARMEEIYQAAYNAGSKSGLLLNMQKMLAGSDYTMGAMLTRQKAAKQRALTPEEKASVEKQERAMSAKEQKIKAAGKKAADVIRTLTVGDKLNKLTGGDNAAMSSVLGLPVGVWDTSIKIIAETVEQGANLADAIAKGIKHIKDNGGFKKKGDDQKFRDIVMNASIDNEKRLAGYKKRTKQAADKIQNKLDNEDFTKGTRTPLQLDKEAMDLRVQLKHAKDEFDLAVLKDEMKHRRAIVKYVADPIRRVISTTRAMVAGVDDSFTMIQAYNAMIANPELAGRAWIEHVKDAASQKRYERNLAEIHNSRLWPLIEKTKLAILEPQSVNGKMVEDIMQGSLHNERINIKVNGKAVNVNPLQVMKPFERAFTSLGNNLRFKLFEQQVAMLESEGKTFLSHPQEYHAAAAVINTITGRGGLPKGLDTASPWLTPFIWSPRLISSSLNILGVTDLATGGNGFYGKLTPTQRRFAIAQSSASMSVGLTALAAFKYAHWAGADGVDADIDPRSVTFGNVTIGNKNYNVFGRFSPYVKLITQVGVMPVINKFKGEGFTGEVVRDGEVVALDEEGYMKPTSLGQAGKFIRGKVTPLVGSLLDLRTGRSFFTRKPYDFGDFVTDNTLPLSLGDVGKNLQRDGTFSLVGNFMLGFEGLKVTDTRDFEDKPKQSTAGVQEPKAPKAPEAPEVAQ